MIDLNSLIEQQAPTRLVKIATSHGGEYAGPCPWCGGNDRFRVWPFSTRAHYWCRSCQKSGDAVQFLKDYKDLTFVEACAELGIEPGETISHAAPTFFDDQPPCKGWQDFARLLTEKAEKYLWSGKADHALEYLKKRGFTEATIRNASLGYIPLANDGKWYTRSFADWGLTDEMLTEKQKEKGCVKVPPGILIPWFADNQLWKLAIKRFEASEGEMRYGQVIGSKDALYNADSLQRDKPVLLLEGEFDVLSALQEAGDIIAPIGTGSVQKGRSPLWIAKIGTYATHILLGYDLDENRAHQGGIVFWKETFGDRTMRWPPFAHDTNDMLKEGKDIRKWIETGLNIATTPQHPLQGDTEEPEKFFCCACKRELDIVEEEIFSDDNNDDHLYCKACWKRHTTPEPVLICPQCGNETKKPREGKCPRCWFESLPPVPKMPEKAKLQFVCKFCKISKWTWSETDQNYVCIKCLSPANWTQKP